jgi:hypothetical protein
MVDQPDRAHAAAAEVEHERRAEPARAHHQHTCGPQPRLSGRAHLLQQDVAGIAAQLVFGEIEVHPVDMGGSPRRAQARELTLS